MAIWSDFKFDLLYPYMLSLASDDPSIVYPYENRSVPALTFDACVARVGAKPGAYSREDMYDRVLLWRVPLIALWATTTLPALGLHTKIFTLLHLVADPIDTLWSLFYKLDLAKCTAKWSMDPTKLSLFTFRDEAPDEDELNRIRTSMGQWAQDIQVLDFEGPGMERYVCDAIAAIITAYDEWGCGAKAFRAMEYAFNPDMSVAHRIALRDQCARTAFFVSSDRVSRVLPSAISTLVFLVQISAGFWKILLNLGDTYNDTNPVSQGLNRAPHNIAFGALFFWLPLAVLMTALVGGSQTRYLMPRVLQRFRHAVEFAQEDQRVRHQILGPLREPQKLPEISPARRHKRWSHGGLPVWQLAKFADFHDHGYRKFGFFGLSLALLAVMIPTGCAVALSWLTPTQGFCCRNMAQLAFFLMWLFNLGMDVLLYKWLTVGGFDLSRSTQNLPKPERSERAYKITFVKDSFFFTATVLTLSGSATGIFNSCNCWSQWTPLGSIRYISFPQEDYIFRLIKRRLTWLFPVIVVLALASQVLIYAAVRWHFRKGHRVLKQRNIDEVLESPDSRRPERAPTFDETVQDTEESHPMIGIAYRSCLDPVVNAITPTEDAFIAMDVFET